MISLAEMGDRQPMSLPQLTRRQDRLWELGVQARRFQGLALVSEGSHLIELASA